MTKLKENVFLEVCETEHKVLNGLKLGERTHLSADLDEWRPSQYIPDNKLRACFIKQVEDTYHPKGVKTHTWQDKSGQWWMREMADGKHIRTVKLSKAPCSVKPDGKVRQKVLPSGKIVDETVYGIIFDYHKAHELPKGTWYND